MFNRLFPKAAIILLVLAAIGIAPACPCWAPPLCAHFAESDFVFTGTIVEDSLITDEDGVLTNRLLIIRKVRVEEVWKGLSPSTVGSIIDVGRIGVESRLQINEKVIVFAKMDEGAFASDHCYGIYAEADYREFVSKVRAWKAGHLTPWFEGHFWMSGKMERLDAQVTQNPYALPGPVDFVIESELNRYATTAKDDEVRITNIAPGMYRLSLADSLLTIEERPEPIDLISNPCDCLEMVVEYKSFISGKLENAIGDPVANAPVEAECIDASGRALGTIPAVSDEDGKFVLRGLEPCTYRIHFQINGPSAEHPYSESFYPGTPTEATAYQHVVTGEETIDLGTVSLGSPVSTKPVQLSVFAPDGMPAVETQLRAEEYVLDSGSEAYEPFTIWRSAQDGVFELSLIPSHRYRFQLRWSRETTAGGSSQSFSYSRLLDIDPATISNYLVVRLTEADLHKEQ